MKRLVHIWLLLLTVLSAVAQQRKDSIQILFPDAYTVTIDSSYLNTSQVLDSIVASLALPENAERQIILSPMTPAKGVDSLYKGVDSLTFARLQSVAYLLSSNGVEDSLICLNTDICDSLNILEDAESATLLPQQEGVWLQIPGGIWLGTGTYDIYQVSPDVAQAIPDSVAPVEPVVPKVVKAPTASKVSRSSRISGHYSSSISSRVSGTLSAPSVPPLNTINHNARIMDSLRHLVSAQQDTIAQYRQQIVDLSQRSTQIVNTPAADPNRSLYVIIVILLMLLLLLLGALLYGRRRRLSDKRHATDLYEQLQAVKKELALAKDELAKSKEETAKAMEKAAFVQEQASPVVPVAPVAPVASSESAVSFDGIYSGKSLYESVADGSCRSVSGWGAVEVRNFIEYYRLQHREFVDSLDTDYNNLSRNHKVFMVLLDMGKTDAEIQKLMGITQTTIRSIRFRIKAKRKSGDESENTQTNIPF